MELNTPYLLPRLSGRFDTLNGGVVTVDEEWFPAFREGIGKFESVLMILTDHAIRIADDSFGKREAHKPGDINSSSFDRA